MREKSRPASSRSVSASSTRMGTGNTLIGRSAERCTAAAASTPPRMLCSLMVKQPTRMSGSRMVQMLEVSLTPVRLSISA